jgi:hypothetical protein
LILLFKYNDGNEEEAEDIEDTPDNLWFANQVSVLSIPIFERIAGMELMAVCRKFTLRMLARHML